MFSSPEEVKEIRHLTKRETPIEVRETLGIKKRDFLTLNVRRGRTILLPARTIRPLVRPLRESRRL